MSHGQLVTEPEQQLIDPTSELSETESRNIVTFPYNKEEWEGKEGEKHLKQ